jgi:iron-sulfur cluster assembly protein
MTARPRPQVMRLTEAAAERLKALAAASGKESAGLRIGVKNGGCAGMEYVMHYAEERGPHDELVEDKGVKLLIDPTAVLFLLGTEMDYRTDKMRSGFVFNNRQAKPPLPAPKSPNRPPSLSPIRLVVPGLEPGIHDFDLASRKDVDGRDKPGHDQDCVEPGS